MISRNFCKNMVRVNLPNFHIVVLHAAPVNFPSKHISLKISIPSIFDELLACFIVPNFCHRFHGGSMCIIPNWFDGKFMMLHDAAAIFKKSLGRETGFFLTVQFISCTFFVTTCPLLQYSIFNALHFVEAMYGWWGTLMYPKSWAWVMTVHLEQFEL